MAKKVKKATLKKAIRRMTEELNQLDPASEEAVKIANNIKTLSEALEKSRSIKGDTVVAAGASVGTAALLLVFEKNNCITSKLLSFIPKMPIKLR